MREATREEKRVIVMAAHMRMYDLLDSAKNALKAYKEFGSKQFKEWALEQYRKYKEIHVIAYRFTLETVWID